MELADTSAWTNRQKNAAVAHDFETRLVTGEIAVCEIVALELLWTTRDEREFSRRRDDLAALPACPIGADAWARALDVFGLLAAKGPLHHRQIALPDLLVAAAAEIAGVPVCHYDRDFEVIAGVTGQPVRAIAPPGSLA